MRFGRIATYIHNDSIITGKGGSLVTLTCSKDVASRTHAFIDFANKVAQRAYAASTTRDYSSLKWTTIIKMFPEIEQERLALSHDLKADIQVAKIHIHRM
jgi:translation elongation factor EF-Ts